MTMLRFTVRDTGVGIPSEKIDLLFTKFSPVDTSTTRKYDGTGLGLAVCKQLAERMVGAIGVTSDAGEGSEFWLTARFLLQMQTVLTVNAAASAPAASADNKARISPHILHE